MISSGGRIANKYQGQTLWQLSKTGFVIRGAEEHGQEQLSRDNNLVFLQIGVCKA